MGINGTKWIKKEEKKNGFSMSKDMYEGYLKEVENIYEAFFGDILKKTEFIEKKG